MFTPRWITLKEALDYIHQVEGGLRWVALEHLVQSLRDQDVKARCASSLEPVPPIYWVDAARNPVHLRQSDYTEIEVCFEDIHRIWPMALALDPNQVIAATSMQGAAILAPIEILDPDGADDRLRSANDRTVHQAIKVVYDSAEAAGKKPPNLKEIAAPVQASLRAIGYISSGRQIQKLAEAPQHKARRRRPGTTIRSEKLGNKPKEFPS